MQQQNQPNKVSLSTIVFLLVVIAIASWFVLNRQWVIDTVRAARFVPSSEIAAIKNDLGLTENGKQLFAASQPQLESADTFNVHCNQKVETNNPILGCYVSQSIFVFDVTNDKLAGIEQTTAAHELLHAVYERMGSDERANINLALHQAYESHKTDELVKRMQHYQQTEPGEEMNELHSILGTEFSGLGDVLEAHYKKYFKDRVKVVAYNKQYNGVFTTISGRLEELVRTINASVDSINQKIKAHNQAVKQLESDQKAFVTKNRRGGFTSIVEFNAEQLELNNRAEQLNTERDEIAADISASDVLRSEYTALANEYNQLNQSINSSLAPKPSLGA